MNKLLVGAAILTAIGIGGLDAELISAQDTVPQSDSEEIEEWTSETNEGNSSSENDQKDQSEIGTDVDKESQNQENVSQSENELLETDPTENPISEEEKKDDEIISSDSFLKEEVQIDKEEKQETIMYEAQTFSERNSQKVLSGVDISHWQNGINVGNLDADFVICKATGGNQYKDPSFNLFAQSALNAGKLLGFYHFAQEASCPGTPEEEASHFYNTVQNYIGSGIPVLDWEADALKKGPAWAKLFLDTFYNLSGVKCLIYMSAYNTRVYDWTDVADSGYKLWLAQYADNNPVYGHDKEPWRDNQGVGAFEEPVIHQYTSSGYISGYPYNLDLDIFYGDINTWKNLAKVENTATQFEMYRVYNPNSGEHFYTKNANEKSYLVSLGWHDEGIGWLAPRTGNSVYRLYNPNAGDHHYTLSANERDILIRAGWQYEGIGWCSDPFNSIPLYRSYNPNAIAGAHHYTVNKNEHDYLISLGWRDEGMAWYGVSNAKRSAMTGISTVSNSSFSARNDQVELLSKKLPFETSLITKPNYKKIVPEIIKDQIQLPEIEDQLVLKSSKYLSNL